MAGWAQALIPLLVIAAPAAIRAETALRPLPYATLSEHLTARISFDSLPVRAEPGWSFDHPFPVEGAFVGAWFAGLTRGQRVLQGGAVHDDLVGAGPALAPLRLQGDGPGQGLAVAHHRGFGSNAVFPLGPRGFDRIDGRGEGALAVLFAGDQAAIGLRIHSDYADPLGSRPGRRGGVRVLALSRDGTILGSHATALGQGITEIGLERPGGRADIAGFLVLNDDAGGIAVDDILLDGPPLLGQAPTPLDPPARPTQDGTTTG